MNKKKFSNYVKGFDFKELFIDLGWDNYSGRIPITADEILFEIKGVVEKRGFVIALCPALYDGEIPLSTTRKKIEHNFRKFHQEHLIIYADKAKTKQIWQFVIQEPDKPRKTREIQFSIDQDSEILFQRARGLLFTLDEEENITLVDVVARFKENFAKNTEKVTKKFYTEFKKRHNAFLDFITGIDDAIADKENKNKQWYASLMLNRLMFCYFIQKRGYLDNNIHYLQDKLKQVKSKTGKNQFYNFYRDFLLELFHKGLGQPETKRELSVELGKIPYLNGGLFDVHELERLFDKIQIKDDAFEKIFNFFDQWNWHLDTRVEASGKDINPDVIGYIFEKYINDRAAMGAYYTKEDITDYIGKNTIIPFFFDKVKKEYPKVFKKDRLIWSFLRESKDTYIYDAVKKGVPQNSDLFEDLPQEIKTGFLPELEQKIVENSKPTHLWEIRKCWNKKAPENIALPTEIYREVIERRKRYAKIKSKIENGEITEINDFITYNLNIRQFTQDVLENIDDPDFIRHFYKALKSVTILDPTCGSGAFLFAAMNILEPLYETCIERMEQFTAEAPRKYKFFHEVLAEVNSREHPNLGYYIYKTIILNNLYGVDIMHEAVEIAKLRLFLKMVGAVDINIRKPNYGLEPLPDVDFNIRAGNTLVGFATEDDFKKALHDREGLFVEEKFQEFEDEFTITAKAFKRFQDSQLIVGKDEDTHKKAKYDLTKRLDDLNEKLNEYLASTYGINKAKQKKEYAVWLESHQPFHWLAEFYEIINDNGGFDVVIGNPPYVVYSESKFHYKVNGYESISCKDLYGYTIERSFLLNNCFGKNGMIVPISLVSTDGFSVLRRIMIRRSNYLYFSNYAMRPGKLFHGVDKHLTIFISEIGNLSKIYSSSYHRWNSDEREGLFPQLKYVKLNNKVWHNSSLPKVSSELQTSILSKIKENKNIAHYLTGAGKFNVYHTRKLRYFVQFLDCAPKIYEEDGNLRVTSELKTLKFSNQEDKHIGLSSFLSNLFFWYYIDYSDCRNVNKREVYSFPLNISDINNSQRIELNRLGKGFLKNLQENSFYQIANYQKYGTLKMQTFRPRKSKPIIDRIDTVLAQHYGFTEEELDFIVNYDIKYRMGKELDAYIEGTLGKESIENKE